MKMRKLLAIGLSITTILSASPEIALASDSEQDIMDPEIFIDDKNEEESEEQDFEEDSASETSEVEIQEDADSEIDQDTNGNSTEDNAGIDEEASDFSEDLEKVFSDDAGNASTSDEDVVASGVCGQNLTWKLSGQEVAGYSLTITGTGKMKSYGNVSNLAPWTDYRQNVKKVYVGEGVTSIGGEAFYEFTKLEEIHIPETIEEVEADAFYHSSYKLNIYIPNLETWMNIKSVKRSVDMWGRFNLYINNVLTENIVIPEDITEIPDYAFSYSNIKSVELHDGVKKIGSCAFYGCQNIMSVDIKNVEILDNAAFSRCDNLIKIKSGNNLKKIGKGCFDSCNSLLTLPDMTNLTELGEQAFSGCRALTSVRIPNNITKIGAYTFYYCDNLKTVKSDGNITSIGEYAFYECSSLKKAEFLSTVTEIGDNAFYNCYGLTDLELSNKLENIGKYAFSKCYNIKKINLGEEVSCIGEGAFQGCYAISEMNLPEKIERIEKYTFAGCYALKEIEIPENVEFIGSQAFPNSLSIIHFYGDAPLISSAFTSSCTAYIPCGNDTWEDVITEDYGQAITWIKEHKGEIEIKNKADATCTEDGYTGDSYCKKCGEKISDGEKIEKLSHDYANPVVTKEATCEEAGVKTYTCVNCGNTRTEEIPATGHKEVKDEAVAATCEKDGLTEGSHCSVCGKVLEEQKTVPATGHNWNAGEITKEATCEETGVKTYTCANCGNTRTEEIPATGHKEVKDEAVAATCEKDGLTEGSHCSVCGKVLEEQKTVPATGHKFGAWKTICPADVFSAEKQSRSCGECGEEEEKEVGSKLEKTITVSASSFPLKTGQKTKILKVTGLAKGDSIVSWKSDNTKIVKVSGKANGSSTVTAGKKTGKARITITLKSGLKRVVTVSVQKDTVKTKKIKGVAKKLKLKKKQKVTLSTAVVPLTSTEKVTYQSSNTKIVAVNSKGQITAKKKGTAVITVKSGNKTARCKVTVE